MKVVAELRQVLTGTGMDPRLFEVFVNDRFVGKVGEVSGPWGRRRWWWYSEDASFRRGEQAFDMHGLRSRKRAVEEVVARMNP